jgi:hypothetical protein
VEVIRASRHDGVNRVVVACGDERHPGGGATFRDGEKAAIKVMSLICSAGRVFRR